MPSAEVLRTNGTWKCQVDKRLQELDQDDRSEVKGKYLNSNSNSK